MKNQYSFARLQKESVSSAIDANDIFIRMRNFIGATASPERLSCLEDLGEAMDDMRHYIVHNISFVKKKKLILSGKLVESDRESILSFIAESIDQGDLRNFLISPIFIDMPEYVIRIGDEGDFFVYRSS